MYDIIKLENNIIVSIFEAPTIIINCVYEGDVRLNQTIPIPKRLLKLLTIGDTFYCLEDYGEDHYMNTASIKKFKSFSVIAPDAESTLEEIIEYYSEKLERKIKRLADTDYHVLKKIELNIDIPNEILILRNELRRTINFLEMIIEKLKEQFN
jgi:hypothetical protein